MDNSTSVSTLQDFNMLSPEMVPIDPTAKLKIELKRVEGKDGNPFFIGKTQFPGGISFQYGVSFMIFNHQSEVEELQIAPLPYEKRNAKRARTLTTNSGVIRIPLKSHQDCDDNTYYVGEGLAPFTLGAWSGLFFSVFTSREGQEELQISTLKHKDMSTKKPVSVSYLNRNKSNINEESEFESPEY